MELNEESVNDAVDERELDNGLPINKSGLDRQRLEDRDNKYLQQHITPALNAVMTMMMTLMECDDYVIDPMEEDDKNDNDMPLSSLLDNRQKKTYAELQMVVIGI